MNSSLSNVPRQLSILGIYLVLVTVLFYVFCLNHVTIGEVGVTYDSMNGELGVQDAGWHRTAPWVRATSIDIIPTQVHIPSAAKVINTKLVRINREHVLDFVRLQGFSWDLGDHSRLSSILMGYAFSGKTFSFLDIIQEPGVETLSPR